MNPVGVGFPPPPGFRLRPFFGVRGGCTPGTAYVSSLHVRLGVCVWLVGEASLGSARHEGLSASARPPPVCVFCARGLVANWGFPRVRPHTGACRSQGDLAPGVLETPPGAVFQGAGPCKYTQTPATLVLGYLATALRVTGYPNRPPFKTAPRAGRFEDARS